jgi:hypothetical protein
MWCDMGHSRKASAERNHTVPVDWAFISFRRAIWQEKTVRKVDVCFNLIKTKAF